VRHAVLNIPPQPSKQHPSPIASLRPRQPPTTPMSAGGGASGGGAMEQATRPPAGGGCPASRSITIGFPLPIFGLQRELKGGIKMAKRVKQIDSAGTVEVAPPKMKYQDGGILLVPMTVEERLDEIDFDVRALLAEVVENAEKLSSSLSLWDSALGVARGGLRK